MKRILLLALPALLVACSDGPTMLAPCDTSDPSTICGVQSAEDMAIIPGTTWIAFSQHTGDYPEGVERDGVGVGLLNTENHQVYPLYDSSFDRWGTPDLGDKQCPGQPQPDQFGGHGMDVRQLDDGTIVLAAVNHGDRESIELFSLDASGDIPTATWRGCVPFPRKTHNNDVALNADGSFFYTYFYRSHRHDAARFFVDLFKSLAGFNTGRVYHWSQEKGVTEIDNSAGVTPNGIVVTPDAKTLYVNEWMSNGFYRLRLTENGVERDNIDLDGAVDNTTWTADGKLLVTGQSTSFPQIATCTTQPIVTTCDIPYEVYQIDPDTLEVTTVITGTGTGSVALQVDDRVYVGTFMGDAIDVKSLATAQ